MKRLFLFFFLICTSAFAEAGDLSCINGNCEGWEGHYEISGDIGKFIFLNKSGKSAFDIKILVNCYDYFDTFIARIERKNEGPINVQMPFIARIPPNTSKMTYDIYWVDEYHPKSLRE